MHKISVVITTYNRKYEVRRALESVYAQTVKPYEIILVDDCSRDGTREYIESFKFQGLKYFELSERKGVGAARNYGILQTHGDYIAFLDSDNEWYQTKLEEFSKALDTLENYWDVVYSKYKKHVNFEVEIWPKELGETTAILKNELWLHNPVDASSGMYKKDFLIEAGFFSEENWTNIDWELLLRIRKKREIRMYKVDKVLTENWTMFDGISEDRELVRKERVRLFSEYANDFFTAIVETNKEREEQYTAERERYRAVEDHYQALLARKDSFYRLLSKWMELKLAGDSLADRLQQNGFERIAVYGAGKHGTFLYQDLKNSKVQVVYFIDRNKAALEEKDIPVYTLEEELPYVDAIVVSTYLEVEIIRQELAAKCDYKLIALNELLEW